MPPAREHEARPGVRGSDLEEGESQGPPVWSRHVGDPILESNLTRRVDFALFMVDALVNDELVREAPAIVGRQTPSGARARCLASVSSSVRQCLRNVPRTSPGAARRVPWASSSDGYTAGSSLCPRERA